MASAAWPVFTLQRWDWSARAWKTDREYNDRRGEGNAFFAVQVARSSKTGPVRLLMDGDVVLADNPDTYFGD